VLIAEPVRPLDGVVHVPAPVVFAHVAERGTHAALGGHGVRTGGKHLGDAGGLQAGGGQAHGGAQAGTARADDQHVIFVPGDVVATQVQTPRASLRMAIAASRPPNSAAARISTISASSTARLWT